MRIRPGLCISSICLLRSSEPEQSFRPCECSVALLVLFRSRQFQIAPQLHCKLDFLICPSYGENNDTPTEVMKPRCVGQEAQGVQLG